jgi:hypothetical protein
MATSSAECTKSLPGWIDLINDSVHTSDDIDIGDVEPLSRDFVCKRPFRIHIDPDQDGCEVINAVANRIRAEFLCRTSLNDSLAPEVNNDS